MPIFEYRCNTCEAEFEKRVRFSEADLIPLCPECASPDTEKKISIFGMTAFGSRSSSNESSCGSSGGFR